MDTKLVHLVVYILSELRQTLDIHVAHGSHLGGVHFEMTGENVTECIGGPEQLDETDLMERYKTTCDPRMNYAQKDIVRQRRFWALETNEQQTLSPEVPPEWTPSSWRDFPIKQQPPYRDTKALEKVLDKLQTLPPLVSVQEIERLRDQLAEVADGKRFLLQGGDCAESFRDCRPDLIEKKLRILMQMSLVLIWGARMPTTIVTRMAGQFAKPRSQETEVIDGVEVCTFRGENVNGFDKNDRTPDPQRLLEGYYHSAATMNYGRLLLDSGFADIHDAGKWDLGFVQNSIRSEVYSHMVSAIQDSLHFVHTCGVGYDTNLKTMDLFISHEGLGLGYEEAMTRK
ncbi:phospho-2-dehydro-3-deoxyheptonate aldolase, partial [Thraustotheca clavata]